MVHLIESAPSTVSSEQLLSRTRRGVVVTDNALHRVISKLRKKLGHDTKSLSYIETIPRRGYRLRTQVQKPGPQITRTRPSIPFVVVLPFATTTEEFGSFASELSAGLSTALRGSPQFFFQFAFAKVENDADIQKTPDYLLSMTLTKDPVRLVSTLVTAGDRKQVWSGAYGDAEGLRNDSDRVLSVVVSQIEESLFTAERERVQGLSESDPWSLVYRAHTKPFNKTGFIERIALFASAIDKAPEYALAYSGRSRAIAIAKTHFLNLPKEIKSEQALALADRALELEGNSGAVVEDCAHTYLLVGDVRTGQRLGEKARDLCSIYSYAHYHELILSGNSVAVIDSQAHPLVNFKQANLLAVANCVEKNYEEAQHWVERALVHRPSDLGGKIALANLLGLQNEVDEALELLNQMRKILPSFDVHKFRKTMQMRWRNVDAIVAQLSSGLIRVIDVK